MPPDAFNRVAYQRDRVRIERRGGRPVYLISEEDLALLEELEDKLLAREARQALETFKKSGAIPIPGTRPKPKQGGDP